MNTALWVIQGVLAGVFLLTGTIKLTQPRAKLAAGPMSWAADMSDSRFRAIGAIEILGAIGVVLPAAIKVAPILTPLAACGLALTMVGAALTHLRLGETSRLVPPLILFALAVFVAIERFGPHSL